MIVNNFGFILIFDSSNNSNTLVFAYIQIHWILYNILFI